VVQSADAKSTREVPCTSLVMVHLEAHSKIRNPSANWLVNQHQVFQRQTSHDRKSTNFMSIILPIRVMKLSDTRKILSSHCMSKQLVESAARLQLLIYQSYSGFLFPEPFPFVKKKRFAKTQCERVRSHLSSRKHTKLSCSFDQSWGSGSK
jgi:hypothetical protein